MSAPIAGFDPGPSFESYARHYFSELWDVDLQPRKVRVGSSVDKKFDLISADTRMVGDAKSYSTGLTNPSGKLATIAEYVWLLQKTNAERVFLVFGNDIRVPERFLKRFGSLVTPVEFYFLDSNEHRKLSR